MAGVIKTAITDEEVLECLSEQDTENVAKKAMPELRSSEISSFIYRCFKAGKEKKGLIILEKAIEYVTENEDPGNSHKISEVVEAATGALSVLSASNPSAKKKLFELLKHDNSAIVAAVVNSLGRSTNLENVQKICALLLHKEFKVHNAAARYLEECTRDCAFREWDWGTINTESEEFLRTALVPLEKAYRHLGEKDAVQSNVEKRTAILVALIYNQILDYTDWKRLNDEEVEERIYYTFEQHLCENIAPKSIQWLKKMLIRPKIEDGVKRSALNTLARMAKDNTNNEKIIPWLSDYIAVEKAEKPLLIAKQILAAFERHELFTPLPPPPTPEERSSIIPRTAGMPPKIED